MSLIKQLIPSSLKRFTPLTQMDWQRIETLVHGPGASQQPHDGEDNSAVFACLMTLSMAYPEPPLAVYREVDGHKERLDDSPLQSLLDMPTPNGELSMSEMLFWTAWAKHVDGNAYWLKIRSGNGENGNVVQLWPVSPAMMKPITERDGSGRSTDWISYYSMQVGTNKYERIEVANVVHFRLGVDSKDMRLGLSPLKRLVRQVASDEEADKFAQALLQNYAVPGLAVIPGQGDIVTREDADRMSQTIAEKFGGNNRGKVAVMSRNAEIKQFGFSPKEMDLSVLHRIPEERIAAVIGVPAILAGLGAGLERGTFSNARELREMFTETRLVPLWRQDADRLRVSLLPDFTSEKNVTVEFDITDVRALQEDEDSKYRRLNLGVNGRRQWITVNEARSDVGLEPVPGGDELDAEVLGMREADGEAEDEKRHPFGIKNIRQIARQVNSRRRIREQVARQAEKDIDDWFEGVADDVHKRAMQILTRRNRIKDLSPDDFAKGVVVRHVQTKDLSPEDFERLLLMIFMQKNDELDEIIREHTLSVLGRSWQSWNMELGTFDQFSENDPLVSSILEAAGDRIKDINQTTLDRLREMLPDLYADGVPIDDVADRVRGFVSETYKNRGRTIARTEIGRSQNQGTSSRYWAAGVEHVMVFDDGFENSHPFCRIVDGKVVTLAWAQRNPLQHPNCVRAFGAVFDYTGEVFTQEEPWN